MRRTNGTRKEKYIRQKFLLNSTQYENEPLEIHARSAKSQEVQEFGTPWNLFDELTALFTRRITVRGLDRIIDTEEDWSVFIAAACQLDLLVVDAASNSPTTINPILRDYSAATLRAYMIRLDRAGVNYIIVA